MYKCFVKLLGGSHNKSEGVTRKKANKNKFLCKLILFSGFSLTVASFLINYWTCLPLWASESS